MFFSHLLPTISFPYFSPSFSLLVSLICLVSNVSCRRIACICIECVLCICHVRSFGFNVLGQGLLGCVWITRNRFIFLGHCTQPFLWTLEFNILFVHLYAAYFVEVINRDNLFSEYCLINHSWIFTMCQTRSVTKVTSYRVQDTEGFCSFLHPGRPALHQTSYWFVVTTSEVKKART